jgi:hypothetical protein
MANEIRCSRAPIPEFGDVQPVQQVREAYWYFDELRREGWRVRAIGYRNRISHVQAITPRQRAISVYCPSRQVVSDLMCEFVNSVRRVGMQTDLTGINHMMDLRRAIHSDPQNRLPGVGYSSRPIPGISIGRQPAPPVRAAYWMIAKLVNAHSWSFESLGSSTAGGGFIANIPDDVLAVYPKDMELDGTVGSALARLLGRLKPAELENLRNYTQCPDRLPAHGERP